MIYSPIYTFLILSCLIYHTSVTTTTSLVPNISSHTNMNPSDNQSPYLYHSYQTPPNHRFFMITYMINITTFPSFKKFSSSPLEPLAYHVVSLNSIHLLNHHCPLYQRTLNTPSSPPVPQRNINGK